ncbi:hypothetical protein FOVG_18195 [Fusarium oxysporum f. sp. pisi HDV247]|uniref:Ketoreductase (KR) domain-containing protein n=1 Tax=Fusarium oxysporum f. sp. pisi HDV247 TaxID=1080344 RepID=W9NI74_FUSOX|nr:hypothetical protein FOVG_18195 [Fusarium oxysporum f. sp. pisi HDV247]
MSSYVISGVSRGIGFELLRQLSENPANFVFGLVRNKAAVEAKVAAEIGRSNIYIIQADTTDPDALKAIWIGLDLSENDWTGFGFLEDLDWIGLIGNQLLELQ